MAEDATWRTPSGLGFKKLARGARQARPIVGGHSCGQLVERDDHFPGGYAPRTRRWRMTKAWSLFGPFVEESGLRYSVWFGLGERLGQE